MPHTMTHMSKETAQCIDDCLAAFRSCRETAAHCIEMGGKHAEPHHIQLLEDCAGICELHADYMMRGSERQAPLAKACADTCRQCAEDCRKFGGDEKMTECAEINERCAKSCAPMAMA